MKYPKFINLIIILLLASLALVACQDTTTAPTPTQKWTEKTPDSVIFEIIRPDGSAAPISLEQFSSLPSVELTLEGKVETGPLLQDILEFAGVTEYSKIKLIGGGRSLDLLRDQVDDQVLLVLTKRGTAKLAAGSVPRSQWINDIRKIRVE